ncbi:peptide ABC transporter substrate-binding protein [Fluviispira vulneris]|uniref:peptide ABC transporter substrate-binding protein n=1 Tax=Fluviispira vulneris TaxID=2763012 RepID=UPI001646F53C|nr:peptide ABC transporter substrate-binding protein [Fluviispira vulneris]
MLLILRGYFLVSFILAQCAFADTAKNPLVAKEQELNIGNLSDPKTLDPQKCNEKVCEAIILQLFEGLVRNSIDGHVLPAAAESWMISADGKTYHFTLRKNLKWSDGTKLTAEDFVFTMKRLVDPKVASEYSTLFENVENGKDIIEGKKSIDSLGVKANDERNLEIKLITATPHFLKNLTISNTFPTQRNNVEMHGDTEEAFTAAGILISNGPFKLSDRKVGNKVTVIRNEHYWNVESVYLSKLNFHSVNDLLTEYRMFEMGQLDATDSIPVDLFKQIKKKYVNEFKAVPFLGSYYYVFNTQRPPFNNKKLRQALSIVIDRDAIVQKVLGRGEKSLYDFVPYGMSNYTQAKPYWQDWTREQQLIEAKKLYKEAGYTAKKPLSVHILIGALDVHQKIATAISSIWKKELGVNTILQNDEWKRILDKRKIGDFEIMQISFVADINDVSNLFIQLRSSDPANDAHFKNKVYDSIINKAVVENNLAMRQKLFQQGANILAEEQPIIPIFNIVSLYLVRPYVTGFKKNILDHYYLTDVHLKEKPKNFD